METILAEDVRYRTLIVEDDAGIAELERRALERAGHQVIVVGTVHEALPLLVPEQVSVVLLDHKLPDSLGWPVLEAASAAVPRIPVILVTAQGDENVAAEAVRRGAADYVIKRGDFLHHLARTVENVVNYHNADRVVQRLRQLQSAILDSVDAQIVLLGRDGTIVLVNEAWKKFADENGLQTPDYCVGRNYLDFASPRASSSNPDTSAREGIQAVLRDERSSFAMEYPCHAPHCKRWYRMVVSTVNKNLVQGAVISHLNITERVLAQQAQDRKTELLTKILDSVEEGIVVSDVAGRIIEWNRAAGAITGMGNPGTLADLFSMLDMRLADGITPCSPQQNPVAVALQGETLHERDYVIARQDEQLSYLSVNASPMRDLTGAVATFHDVTERVLRHRAIRQMAAVLEQTADAVLITNTDGCIEYVNPAMEALYGYPREELLGTNPRVLKSGEVAAETFRDMWQTIVHGEVWKGRVTNRSKHNELYQVDVVITPIRNDRGDIVQFVATQRDVTSQLHLEEQFRHSQKMEAIGQLAGGIAHDFNNLLGVIHGYSEMMLEDERLDDGLREDVAHIIHASESAASLTRQMLALGRRQELKPQRVSPNTLLTELQRMLNRLIPENIRMELVLGPDVGYIMVDTGQFEQVLINLVVNARDAMPQGGKICITTDLAEISGPQADQPIGMQPGTYVLVRISDTGTGMSPDVMARIFEPFYTTKELDKGTGLGLSTVHGIVTQSGGYIWPRSEPGRGTVFSLYFPHHKVSDGTARDDNRQAPRQRAAG